MRGDGDKNNNKEEKIQSKSHDAGGIRNALLFRNQLDDMNGCSSGLIKRQEGGFTQPQLGSRKGLTTRQGACCMVV